MEPENDTQPDSLTGDEPAQRPGQIEQVGGDKITIETVSNKSVVAIGRGASVSAMYGAEFGSLGEVFAAIYQAIEEREPDPDVEKEEIVEAVQRIEAETTKSQDANTKKMERWLRSLALMAPDIFDVVSAALVSPAAGISAVIRNVVKKAREQAAEA